MFLPVQQVYPTIYYEKELFDNSAAEAVFAVVEDGGLAGGDALVFFGEGDFEAVVGEWFDDAGLDAGAVADLGLEVERGRMWLDGWGVLGVGTARQELRPTVGEWVAVDPVGVGDGEFFAGEVEVTFGVGDVNNVFFEVFFDDVPRAATHSEAFALADGVEPDAFVFGEFLAGLNVDDVASFFAEVKADEFRVFNFAEEADALAVAAVAVGKVQALGLGAHFAFEEVTDGKEDSVELLLTETGEEVGLIFDGIRRAFKPELAVPFFDLRVVAGGNFVEAGFDFVEEQAEFDPLVTKDVGAGSATGFEFGNDVIDDAFLVFGLHRNDAKGDAGLFADGAGVL